jgi:hypothetical protein
MEKVKAGIGVDVVQTAGESVVPRAQDVVFTLVDGEQGSQQ